MEGRVAQIGELNPEGISSSSPGFSETLGGRQELVSTPMGLRLAKDRKRNPSRVFALPGLSPGFPNPGLNAAIPLGLLQGR